MKIKARKAETDALSKVLLTPLSDFLTAKDDVDSAGRQRTDEQLMALAQKRMFEAGLEAAYEQFFKREFFAVVLRYGKKNGYWTGWFGYGTQKQAIDAIGNSPMASMATAIGVVPMRHETNVAELLAATDAPAETKGQFAEVAKDNQARRAGWKGKAVDRDRYLK